VAVAAASNPVGERSFKRRAFGEVDGILDEVGCFGVALARRQIPGLDYRLRTPAAPRWPIADVLDEPEPDGGPWPQGTPGQAD